MRFPLAAFAALMLCACVTTRTITPGAYRALEQPPLASSWSLTKVAVTPPTNPAVAGSDFTPAMQELERHVRAALVNEPAVGRHTENLTQADHTVEIDVHLVEGNAPNGWYAAGLTGAVVLPAGGTFAGALVASAALAGTVPVIGAVLGGAIALGVAAALPMETRHGQLTADIVVRRAKDGMAIASRSERVSWVAMVSTLTGPATLAEASGAVVPELERAIARSVAAVFVALPQSPVPP